jgi:hypothetical protein
MACRAASAQNCSGSFLGQEDFELVASASARTSLGAQLAVARDDNRRSDATSGCTSSAKVPSEPITRMRRSLVGVAGANLLDARIVGARGFVGAEDQLDFL